MRKRNEEKLAGYSVSRCNRRGPEQERRADKDCRCEDPAGHAEQDISEGAMIPAEPHVGQSAALEDPNGDRVRRRGRQKRSDCAGDQDSGYGEHVVKQASPM